MLHYETVSAFWTVSRYVLHGQAVRVWTRALALQNTEEGTVQSVVIWKQMMVWFIILSTGRELEPRYGTAQTEQGKVMIQNNMVLLLKIETAHMEKDYSFYFRDSRLHSIERSLRPPRVSSEPQYELTRKWWSNASRRLNGSLQRWTFLSYSRCKRHQLGFSTWWLYCFQTSNFGPHGGGQVGMYFEFEPSNFDQYVSRIANWTILDF